MWMLSYAMKLAEDNKGISGAMVGLDELVTAVPDIWVPHVGDNL
jgi:hypothetical protein